MFGINIFDKTMMPIDWVMIYYGIKNNFLNIDVAQEFACRKLECDESLSEEEQELLWKANDRLEVLELIAKILNKGKNIEESLEKAKDKVRVAIIIYLRETEKNEARLLEKIAMIYADFDYPKDMESFISYMPIDYKFVATNSIAEDSRNYLLSNLDNFIQVQQKKYHL